MWDLKCICAAICFLTSNVLYIVNGVMMMEENKASHTASANGNFDAGNSYNDSKEQEQSVIKSTSFNFNSWKDLDPVYIEERWAHREQTRPITMTAALFGALAWFWLIVPIVQSAWVLSRGGKRMIGPHMLLAAFAICGGIIEFLARLLTVGMTNASQWLAKDFNLDDWDSEGDGTGWRVLEMIHIVTRGMLLWIDAFEALALFGIVVVLFYSIATEPKFKTKRGNNSILVEHDHDGADAASGSAIGESDGSAASTPPPPTAAFAAVSTKTPIKPTFTRCFGWYGLFVGLLAVLDFVADVLRFVDWKIFGKMALATNALLGVIFLPIWLLCLARQLPDATARYEHYEKRNSMLLNTVEGDEKTSLLAGNDREIS